MKIPPPVWHPKRLNEKELWIVVNGLRAAAAMYTEGAAAVAAKTGTKEDQPLDQLDGDARVVVQFKRQAREAELLADRFEEGEFS